MADDVQQKMVINNIWISFVGGGGGGGGKEKGLDEVVETV